MPKTPEKDETLIIKESFKSNNENELKINIQETVDFYLQLILKQ